MNEINNLTSIQQLQSALQQRKSTASAQPVDREFEELLKTVEKLELMDSELESVGSEITSALKTANVKDTRSVSSGVNKIGHYIKNIEGLVETLSKDTPPETKANRYGVSQYAKNKTKNG